MDRIKDPLSSLKIFNAITCSENTAIFNVVSIMREKKIGSVVILNEQNKLSGIFTERDYLMKIAEKNFDGKKLKVSEFMTPSPVFMKENETIESCIMKMQEGKFRHMIITDLNEEPVFVISQRDLLDYLTNLGF